MLRPVHFEALIVVDAEPLILLCSLLSLSAFVFTKKFAVISAHCILRLVVLPPGSLQLTSLASLGTHLQGRIVVAAACAPYI